DTRDTTSVRARGGGKPRELARLLPALDDLAALEAQHQQTRRGDRLAVGRRPVPGEAHDDPLASRDDVLDLEARIWASVPHFGVVGLQALEVGDAERVAVQDDVGRIELEVTHALLERPVELLQGTQG